MNVLSWNCRGLAAASTVQELKDLCKRVKPAIVFLMETRAKEAKVEHMRRKLLFDKVFCVEPEGLSGGLCLFWKKEVEVEIIEATKNFIHTFCRSKDDGAGWDSTFIYGNPRFSERRFLWEAIKLLHWEQGSPWMCFGDFNEIAHQEEKIGLRPHSQHKIELFREFMQETRLMDMEVKGCRFTWMSNPRNGFMTKERIDRLLVNWEWRQTFPNAVVTAYPSISSDHTPLVLICKPKVGDGGLFKYEAFWEEHEDCNRVIGDGWSKWEENEDPWNTLLNKVNSCKKDLTAWNKAKFKNAAKEIAKLKEQLAKLLNSDNVENDFARISAIKEEIRKLWDREEKYWGQRSRLKWVTWGDKNTKFFHASTIQRRERNRIQRLKNSRGEWVEGQEEVTQVVCEYFQGIYNSTNVQHLFECLSVVPRRVTAEMNSNLLKPVSNSEIRTAVFSLGALKAPGKDGLNGTFFQNHWDVVGESICAAVKAFFQYGTLPDEINETLTVLVPKQVRPEEVSQFRPISCCNFTYKIITKIMVLRLKQYMNLLVSPNQCAFIGGRLIQDNIMVTQEILHSMRQNTGIAKNCFIAKLDMSKAYDRLEWVFLEECLKAYGFDQNWVEKVMKCVRGVSYRFKINGIPSQRIIPQRGLRQGDPLSPYLFILAMDALSHLLGKVVFDKKIVGIKITAGAPTLTHLLFADDLIIFAKADTKEAYELMSILNLFSGASGQRINTLKSGLIFGKQVPHQVRSQIGQIFNMQVWNDPGKYLGLPAQWGR